MSVEVTTFMAKAIEDIKADARRGVSICLLPFANMSGKGELRRNFQNRIAETSKVTTSIPWMACSPQLTGQHRNAVQYSG